MRRRPLLIVGAVLMAFACLLGVFVVIVPGGATGAVDLAWGALVLNIRTPEMITMAYFMNWIGGGWRAIVLVPLVVVAVMLALRRWRAAVYALSAFLLSAGMVQLLKHLFGRARPEDMLVLSDYGSFPSGHTANAATLAVVLWVVFPRVWTAFAGVLWVAAMALSRTVLSVHWATDTVAGALVGAGAALFVAGIVVTWATLNRSPHRAVTTRSIRAEDPPLS